MGRGYADGPAVDAAEQAREAAERGERPGPAAPLRAAVFGSTPDRPEPHFLGWADEVDADALFAAGTAWGLSVRRVAG